MASDPVIHLTLAGGSPLVVRRELVIAAHIPVKGDLGPTGANAKIYLSNGATLFVRETPEEAVR